MHLPGCGQVWWFYDCHHGLSACIVHCLHLHWQGEQCFRICAVVLLHHPSFRSCCSICHTTRPHMTCACWRNWLDSSYVEVCRSPLCKLHILDLHATVSLHHVLAAVSAGCADEVTVSALVWLVVTVSVHDSHVVHQLAALSRGIGAALTLEYLWLVDFHDMLTHGILGHEELSAFWAGQVTDVHVDLHVIVVAVLQGGVEVADIALEDLHSLIKLDLVEGIQVICGDNNTLFEQLVHQGTSGCDSMLLCFKYCQYSSEHNATASYCSPL